MTAEIAILNREAIALAADSAATFRSVHGQKIFTSANKIFTLSKYHPVGVMIFGNAVLHETPWETIIKMYRRELGKKKFATLDQQAKHFLGYLKNKREFSSAETQATFVRHMVSSYFELIKDDILKQVKHFTNPASGQGVITTSQIPGVVSLVLNKHLQGWTQSDNGPHVTSKLKSSILRIYKTIFDENLKKIFEKLPLTTLHKQKLMEIAALIFVKRANGMTPPFRSGLVIAGFGDKDIYPQCINYSVLGIAANHLIYFEESNTRVSSKNSATIAPFAQDDVAKSFIGGVDPRYEVAIRQEFDTILQHYPNLILDAIDAGASIPNAVRKRIENDLSELIKKKSAEYKKALDGYKREKYIFPMLNVVSMLPKDELANMAETLVNLTSFKRRVSMAEETVGGPVDVAVISKGDGFVWIKRKHYFTKELNPSFVTNYFNG